MNTVLTMLRGINKAQREIDAGSSYPDLDEMSRATRDFYLEELKKAGFSVIYHKKVERWCLYLEDREA